MKVFTARAAASCIALCTSPFALAQDVALTMKPKKMRHGTGVHVELLLDAHSNPAPAALQWDIKIPPGLHLAEVAPGEAVKKAGKTLVCDGTKCLVYGWNRTTIPNGQIAIATFRTAPSTDRAKGFAQVDSERRNRKPELQIVDIVAASFDGKAIRIVSGSGATGVSKSP